MLCVFHTVHGAQEQLKMFDFLSFYLQISNTGQMFVYEWTEDSVSAEVTYEARWGDIFIVD